MSENPIQTAKQKFRTYEAAERWLDTFERQYVVESISQTGTNDGGVTMQVTYRKHAPRPIAERDSTRQDTR